ncbi:hypothetical protein UFOVP1326_19 [uncultured Caudovirales phage]|uniref:Uncharacterized protein n=1 Tax=uncultured Caudovirales phage TaxID=2100421 RepID=A0A6J5SED0_9CAUD|nr:hypothetical protein UFOVP1326_19 [uncultured Caudovirales phage]CAB4212572.1 hypothetical protein UFOVP1436_20 [uncultured Caudovirales phage]
MTQAIEDNTKALNRLNNTLLSIFKIMPAVVETVNPGPVVSPHANAGAKAIKAAQTTPTESPAAATQAAAPAAIPMVRESASRLTLHMASSNAEGQGKEAAVALLAEFNDADGNPCRGAKALQESDIAGYLKRIIGIIGEAQARTVLGIK